MQSATPSTHPDFRLPWPIALPLGLMPGPVHSALMAALVNRFFRESLRSGELAFLHGRALRVTVVDIGVHYSLIVQGERLRIAPKGLSPSLWIKGNSYEFLQMAAGQEDPDTLFFNRRLRLGGDTELGVQLKYFLDAHTLDPALAPVRRMAQRLLALPGIRSTA